MTLDHPWSTELDAYDSAGTLLTQDSGAAIHPSSVGGIGVIPMPGAAPSGPSWSDVANNLAGMSGGDQRAISLTLADPAVQMILAVHAGWITTVGSWTNCGGTSLGQVIEFQFDKPASFTAVLPTLGPPAGAFSYSVTVRREAASAWPVMTVSVATSSSSVVGVAPVGSPPPGDNNISVPHVYGTTTTLATITPAYDVGPPDYPSCWNSDG